VIFLFRGVEREGRELTEKNVEKHFKQKN